MLADLNFVVLLLWLAVETIPALADHLADVEIELRQRDRHD